MTGAPGTDPAALAVVDANLVSHATHLHGDLAGAAVRRVAGTTIADSGLAHDTFNQIGGARPAVGDAPRVVRDVLADVRAHGGGRPFSWWVPQDDRGVSAALEAQGRPVREHEAAMWARTAEVPAVDPPDGARIEVVSSPTALADYAHLLASLFTPYAEAVVDFHARLTGVLLRRSARSRFVLASTGGVPLAGAELHHDGRVAGLYGVVTAPIARGRGLGTAVSAAAVAQAGALGGAERVVLQASAAGRPVYERLGFRVVGTYAEHPLD